ncbi:MAG: cytochrome c [Egibacteraceae bacterium]
MTPTTIAIVILVVAAFATIVLLIANASSRRQRGEDIAPGLRPAYSDEQLEGSVLERYMLWGLVLTLLFAVFLPVYWLLEPRRIQGRAEARFSAQYVRGEQLFEQNCSRCHGTDGSGGSAASPYGGQWPAPNLTNIAARYDGSKIVTNVEEHIVNTIRRGRPGTPMPSWGADFNGPLTDTQIEDIKDWILANQVPEVTQPQAAANRSGEQLYQENCVRCHGENLQGQVGPTLIGVFERHDDRTILGILQNGIAYASVVMPPWQNGYLYEDSRYTDEALNKIVEYLRSRQPAQPPPGADQYQTPGRAQPDGGQPGTAPA